VKIDATLESGVLRIARLAGHAWGGAIDVNGVAEAKSKRVAVKLNADNVNVNALLKDVAGKDLLEGTGRVVADVNTNGATVGAIGFKWDDGRRDIARGVALFAVVGLTGLGIYLAAVCLGVNRFVVPAPPPDHWWTYPAVFMNAFGAAFLEEVVVLAYLVTRLRQLAWSPVAIVLASALLRGSYHLYQGWGGFFGNLLMGALFAVLFLKWRRAWPFVITHFLLDATAAVGWLAFRGHLPCI